MDKSSNCNDSSRAKILARNLARGKLTNQLKVPSNLMDQAKDIAINIIEPYRLNISDNLPATRFAVRASVVDLLGCFLSHLSENGTKPIRPANFHSQLKTLCPDIKCCKELQYHKDKRIVLDKLSHRAIVSLIQSLIKPCNEKNLIIITGYILACAIDLFNRGIINEKDITHFYTTRYNLLKQATSETTLEQSDFTFNNYIEGLTNLKFSQL